MARFAQTTTPLGSGGTYSTGTLMSDVFDSVKGAIFSDQAGTIYIEQSSDGVNWDVSTDYAVTASDGKGFEEDLLLAYFRVRYVNGGTPQTTFRLTARSEAAGNRY